jgi:glycosidase
MAGVNVADQDRDPASLLNFYRAILRIRKNTPALLLGDYLPLHEQAEAYLAFLRSTDGQACLIILNMSARSLELDFDLPQKSARLLFSSRRREKGLDPVSCIEIEPFEVYIAELA